MKPLNLLFVDDDADIRAIAEMALALDPGLTVRSAGSAADALAMLRDDAGWRPDGVLLDVMMPGMAGPDLALAIRSLPGLADVPLLFMTARARDSDVKGYLAIGRSDFIAKPFDPLTLASDVRTRLGG